MYIVTVRAVENCCEKVKQQQNSSGLELLEQVPLPLGGDGTEQSTPILNIEYCIVAKFRHTEVQSLHIGLPS